MRFVTEKHKQLIESLDNLVNTIAGEKLDAKKIKADDSLVKATDLKGSISAQDCPQWLPALITGLQHFKGGTWNQQHLISHLINNLNLIKNYKWIFETTSETGFDFDSIFQHYKSQSRLPELFAQIIKILEEIRESGQVDSVSMISALEKVIATLKKNKNGSYFSVHSAWSFLLSFLKNYMWGELSKIPVLGTALEALEKTIQEMDEEMVKVQNEVQGEMKKMVETEIRGLTNKSEFRFMSYNKSGSQLLSTTTGDGINESA